MERLVRQHRRALLKSARKFCLDHAEAEDLVRRTIVHVLEHPGSLHHDTNPAAWLAKVMFRIHLAGLRKGSSHAKQVSIDDVQVAAPDPPEHDSNDSSRSSEERKKHLSARRDEQ